MGGFIYTPCFFFKWKRKNNISAFVFIRKTALLFVVKGTRQFLKLLIPGSFMFPDMIYINNYRGFLKIKGRFPSCTIHKSRKQR